MKKILAILFMCFLLAPTTALAATFRADDSGTSAIDSGETFKNAYLAGNDVNVTGTVSEDLVAAGNTISVSGIVNDNANIVGNSIVINGQVGKTVRTAGSTVTINSNVGSDLFAAGGTITVGQSAIINDDLSVAGGTINLNGVVGGTAYLTGGKITIDGTINGDVVIKGGDKVTIGDNAVIGGNLKYQAQQVASISPNAKINGTTDFTQIINQHNIGSKVKVGATVFALLMALASFILLLVMVCVFPKTIRNVVEKSFSKPWENLGVGFVYLVVVPIAAIVLLVTLIGIPLGFLAFGLYAVTLGLAKLLVSIMAGSLIFKWLGKEKTYRLDWLSVLVGVIAVFVVGLIPFFGSLALFVVFLIALSQFARGGMELIKSQR